MGKRIVNISLLNYDKDLKAFLASWQRLVDNWKFDGIDLTPEWQKDDMLIYAAGAGNSQIIKYLVEELGADPHLDSRIFNANNYPIVWAMRWGRGSTGGSFRQVIEYLMDEHNCDPSVNNNAILKAANDNGLRMFATDDKPHDRVIAKILADERVSAKIFELKQEQYYYLFPNVQAIFIF